MSTQLDLDDVASTSQTAKSELDDLRRAVGDLTNPRYVLWQLHVGEALPLYEFLIWIPARVADFNAEHGRKRGDPIFDQDAFTRWMMQWVRRELIGQDGRES